MAGGHECCNLLIWSEVTIPASGDHDYMDTRQRELNYQFHTRNFNLLKSQKPRLDAKLETLYRHLNGFPLAQVHLYMDGVPRRKEFEVKAVVYLPGRTLVATARDPLLVVACDHCIHNLAENVAAYKHQLNDDSAAPGTMRRRARGSATHTRPRTGRLLSPDSGQEMFESDSAASQVDFL